MTEDEWLTSTDLRALSKALPQPLLRRKLILVACGYVARVRALIPVPGLLELVGAVEAGAEAGQFRATLRAECDELNRFTGGMERNGPGTGLCTGLQSLLRFALHEKPFIGCGMQQLLHAALAQFTHPDPGRLWGIHPGARRSAGWWAAFHREERTHADLLRDVFGNPFRPVPFSPSWRTDTAVSLARTMYESRDFSAMPILADALQDAGCDSAEILDHCRDTNQVHARGCWVMDLVLDKE